MGKIIKHYNYRVEVEPRRKGDLGVASISGEYTPEEQKRQCENIAEQIRRHVDDIPSGMMGNVSRGVHVICDGLTVCEHCEDTWTEGDSPHNGGCCDKDAEVMEAEDPVEVPGE